MRLLTKAAIGFLVSGIGFIFWSQWIPPSEVWHDTLLTTAGMLLGVCIVFFLLPSKKSKEVPEQCQKEYQKETGVVKG